MKKDPMTEDRKYHLTGTLEELQNILQTEFSMEADVAKFTISILTVKDEMNQAQDSDEMALWYVGQKTDPYATPFLDSRFSISFSEVGKDIMGQLFLQFGAGLLTGSGLPIVSFALSCIASLVKHSTYIKPDECCPYYCALKWRATHQSQSLMSVSDLIPKVTTCSYLDKIHEEQWSCPYCRDDKCEVTEKYFNTVIRRLADKDVFEFIGDLFRFKR